MITASSAIVVAGRLLPLTAVMEPPLAHAKRLRSPDTATYHALRAGAWCEGKKEGDAEVVAVKMIADMHGAYALATINRTLGAQTALTIAYKRHDPYGLRRQDQAPSREQPAPHLFIHRRGEEIG